MERPPKITFGEMRESGVRGILVYCADYRCSHSIAVNADNLQKVGPDCIGGAIYWRRIASVLDFAPVRSEFDQKRIVDNESVLVLGLNAWIA